ncbi:hypothetical protein CkaCkLH20_12556 [Colletotrichum karsti]|uniref:AIG1-type G domain-containing protein n=1 Tax=Colletotrichum karsti TaxID=1095194 RepID=A0A9P6HUC1_9PEZI|nr:uncharacterized protein CkaCkLH20_12556 [Colletotrichum karsti]KAF9869947.1 hypothetical protein CkaCkLH20_12556 [Colletotrichum karsti]
MDDSNEGVILVMGVTGAGKSYFLNQLKSQCVKEGHSLSSETQGCQAVQIYLDGDESRSITVVDTPGFDDTERSSDEILVEITNYLAAQHASGLPLRGILYLHRITDNRMTNTSKSYLRLLESLVGDDALRNVILVTTMWNMLRPEDRRRGLQREQELLDNFWSSMEQKGSYVAQFDGTADSAYALVFQLAGKDSVVLDIQKETVEQDRSILETTAGMNLIHQLKKDSESYQLQMSNVEKQLELEMREEPRDKDKIRQLKTKKQEIEKILRLMNGSVERMKVHPGSPMRDRMKDAMKKHGMDAVAALSAVLNVTYFVVRLVLGA